MKGYTNHGFPVLCDYRYASSVLRFYIVHEFLTYIDSVKIEKYSKDKPGNGHLCGNQAEFF